MRSVVPGYRRSNDGTARSGLPSVPLTSIPSCIVVREGCISSNRHGAVGEQIDSTCEHGTKMTVIVVRGAVLFFREKNEKLQRVFTNCLEPKPFAEDCRAGLQALGMN